MKFYNVIPNPPRHLCIHVFEKYIDLDDIPNVWATTPTHWMPLPAAPKP